MERTNKRDDIRMAVEKHFKKKLYYRMFNRMPRERFYRVRNGMFGIVERSNHDVYGAVRHNLYHP